MTDALISEIIKYIRSHTAMRAWFAEALTVFVLLTIGRFALAVWMRMETYPGKPGWQAWLYAYDNLRHYADDALIAGLVFTIIADLDFASDSDYADWTPIGTYTGVFDGKGHPMSNLAITSATGHVGLFGVVQGPNALLAGVRLPDVDISVAPFDVGALAGFVGDGGAVRTSYASGTIAAAVSGANRTQAGGLVGRAAESHIAASHSQVSVTVTSDMPAATIHAASGVGGLVGVMSGARARPGALTAVYATGAVSSNWESAPPRRAGGP